MRKITLIIFALLTLFKIQGVSAMTLIPTSDTTSKRGEELSVYITLNKTLGEKTISALDGKFIYDTSVFEMVDSSNLMAWTEFSGISNNKKFAYANLKFDNLITSTVQNIVKVNFKVKNNAKFGETTISITEASATDELGNGVEISGGNHSVRILSDVNTLANIDIEGISIDFSENTTEYNLTTNRDSTNIIAFLKDSNSTMSGDIGTKALNYGINTFKITVVSESGIKKVYTLNITRIDNRSKINTISKLSLSNGAINFDKDVNNYNLTVGYDVSDIKVDATLSSDKATFLEGYGPRTVKLNIGNNVIILKVIAENELVNIYTLNITRNNKPSETTTKAKETNKTNSTNTQKEEINSNNYLREILINGESLIFNKEEYEHKITVPYNTGKLEIAANTEDENATYEIIGNENLEVGENVYIIKVQAENGTIREYKIIVQRKEENISLSNNSKLKKLIVDGYEINFDKDVHDYTIKISNESELNILYSMEDSKSNVIILGNDISKKNTTIRVIVTAEDRTTTEYRINVERDNTRYDVTFVITVVLGILSFLTLIVFIYFMLKEFRKKRKKY